jgi:C-terminal processing protease CtpA/Prc
MNKASVWNATALFAIPLMAVAAKAQNQSNSSSQQSNQSGQTQSASGNQGSNSNNQPATNSSSSKKSNSNQTGQSGTAHQQQKNSNTQQSSTRSNSQQGINSDKRSNSRDTNRDTNNVQNTRRGSDESQRSDNQSDRNRQSNNRNRSASDLGFKFERGSSNGLVISSVSTDGPIARLGFRNGDRIVSVNGHRVSREDEIVRYLLVRDVERVPVIVVRDGREETIYVEPSVFVEEDNYVSDPLERFGIVVEEREDRIVVVDVTDDSPAYRAGIRRDDILMTVGGHSYRSKSEVEKAVGELKSGEAKVQVRRGEKTRDFSVKLPQSNDSKRGDSDRKDRSERRSGDRGDQSSHGNASSDNSQNKRSVQREREDKTKADSQNSNRSNDQSKSESGR